MQFAKRLFMGLGVVALMAVLLSLIAPKAVHGLVATLVQIVPGPTTHVGQAESQLVSLLCFTGNNACYSRDSSGNPAYSAYQVPSGYTLVITDYEYTIYRAAAAAANLCDSILASSGPVIESCAVADINNFAYGKEHFTTGIRVASGVVISDSAAFEGEGTAQIQGYLVPN